MRMKHTNVVVIMLIFDSRSWKIEHHRKLSNNTGSFHVRWNFFGKFRFVTIGNVCFAPANPALQY